MNPFQSPQTSSGDIVRSTEQERILQRQLRKTAAGHAVGSGIVFVVFGLFVMTTYGFLSMVNPRLVVGEQQQEIARNLLFASPIQPVTIGVSIFVTAWSFCSCAAHLLRVFWLWPGPLVTTRGSGALALAGSLMIMGWLLSLALSK